MTVDHTEPIRVFDPEPEEKDPPFVEGDELPIGYSPILPADIDESTIQGYSYPLQGSLIYGTPHKRHGDKADRNLNSTYNPNDPQAEW